MANVNTAQLATQIAATVAALGPQAVLLILQLEALGQLGPDELQNVLAAVKAGLEADQHTVDIIDNWRKVNGLPTGGGL